MRKTVLATFLPLAMTAALSAQAGGIERMYVLGDSLSDQGNLFAATSHFLGVPPEFGVPNALRYYEGRFSNGPVYADVLADMLNISLSPSCDENIQPDLPYELSYSCAGDGDTNFAYGGARTDYNTVERPPAPAVGFPEGAFPWSLNGQLGEFERRGIEDLDGLYIVFSGSNDLVDLIPAVASKPPAEQVRFISEQGFIGPVVEGIRNSILEFAAAGRQILVPNTPDLGVVPGVTALKDIPGFWFVEAATSLSTAYKDALATMLQELEEGDELRDDVNIIPFDTFAFLTDVVDAPEAFGFSNATEACYEGFVAPGDTSPVCDYPEDYVFWDKEHPTTEVHVLLAEAMLETIALDILDDLAARVVHADLPRLIEWVLTGYLNVTRFLLTDDDAGNDKWAVFSIGNFKERVDRMARRNRIPQDTAEILSDGAEKLKSVLRAR